MQVSALSLSACLRSRCFIQLAASLGLLCKLLGRPPEVELLDRNFSRQIEPSEAALCVVCVCLSLRLIERSIESSLLSSSLLLVEQPSSSSNKQSELLANSIDLLMS